MQFFYMFNYVRPLPFLFFFSHSKLLVHTKGYWHFKNRALEGLWLYSTKKIKMISKLLIRVCLYENDDVKNIKPQIPVFFLLLSVSFCSAHDVVENFIFTVHTHTHKKKRATELCWADPSGMSPLNSWGYTNFRVWKKKMPNVRVVLIIKRSYKKDTLCNERNENSFDVTIAES